MADDDRQEVGTLSADWWAQQAAAEVMDAGFEAGQAAATVSVALSLREIARAIAEVKEVLRVAETAEEADSCPYAGATHERLFSEGRACPLCGLRDP